MAAETVEVVGVQPVGWLTLIGSGESETDLIDGPAVSGTGVLVGGTGVLVTQRSALQFLPGPGATISGNGAHDLVCSIQGTAYGDASGIPHKQIDCKSFEQFP